MKFHEIMQAACLAVVVIGICILLKLAFTEEAVVTKEVAVTFVVYKDGSYDATTAWIDLLHRMTEEELDVYVEGDLNNEMDWGHNELTDWVQFTFWADGGYEVRK